MKYLILGINGMAGHMIAQYLVEQGREVTGFARTESPICKTILGDARNENDIKTALQSAKYDVVVNAMGVLNKAVDNNLAAGIYLNSVFPHFVAETLAETNTKLIHISTDCVFEGTKGKYKETDFTDATSYYGKSKALGEVDDNKNLTIRTSIIGPELKADGVGLFHWFMSQNKEVYGYKNVIWAGVTTLQLAKAILADEAIHQTGLIHLCNNQVICKYDLLYLFNDYCRQDKVTILQNTDLTNDKSIINTREDVEYGIPDYDAMIHEMAEWIKKHSDLYKQYFH